MFVSAPAHHGLVGLQAAGVTPSRTNGLERAYGGMGLAEVVEAPAVHGAVGAQAAGVGPTGTDGLELSRRGRNLILVRAFRVVLAPTGEGSADTHAASVKLSRTYGLEWFCRGRNLTKLTITPACHGAVVAYATGVTPSRTDRFVMPLD